MIVGIDLGTTYSAVAALKDGTPEILPSPAGDRLTPSVVAFDEEGRPLVGRAAREYETLHPDRAASVFKRQMGTNWSVKLGGQDRTAVDLSALVLADLKATAEAALGEPVERAVVTVPAYFNDAQRTATIEAGEAAGLSVARIINEPTAAAIAYGLHDNEADRTAVVVDLGGGTFDVSVIEQFEGVVEVRASAGEIFLGGEDFTTALVAFVLRRQGGNIEVAEMKAPGKVARLRHECERAKRQLTQGESAAVRVPDDAGRIAEGAAEVTVTKKDFEEATKNLLDRVVRPLRRALGDARLKPDDVDDVILVGGATRMPQVVTMCDLLFSKPPLSTLPADEVVALGAAVQGGLVEKNRGLGDLVVTDVCPFTLGVETTREIGHQRRDGYFMPIIPRNTPIPTSRVERVGTVHANQTQIRVKVFQGESRMVEENLLLGEFEVGGIPKGPAGQSIDIRFTYDLNGVLEAEATVVDTEEKATLVITRHASGMDTSEVRRAIAAMAELKKEWRDEPENRTLLLRAERLYKDLTGIDREALDELITAFEFALAEKDEEGADIFRRELGMFVSARDRGFETDGESA